MFKLKAQIYKNKNKSEESKSMKIYVEEEEECARNLKRTYT